MAVGYVRQVYGCMDTTVCVGRVSPLRSGTLDDGLQERVGASADCLFLLAFLQEGLTSPFQVLPQWDIVQSTSVTRTSPVPGHLHLPLPAPSPMSNAILASPLCFLSEGALPFT